MKQFKSRITISWVLILLMILLSVIFVMPTQALNEKPPSDFNYGSVDIDDEEPTRGATTMTINTSYSATLTAGAQHIYYFTPSSTGMYAVETSGSTDTYGTVTGQTFPTGTITNDDSGLSFNFAIGFNQNANGKVTIKVRGYSSCTTGSYSIKVRQQRAQFYTFDYPNGDSLNTIPDAATPKSWSSSMGYLNSDNQNKSSSHPLENDSTGFTRLNSEIFFFSGHGSINQREEDGKILGYGGAIRFYGSNDWLYSSKVASMNNTKVAVWSACYSACTSTGIGETSLVHRAIQQGAKSAIGWVNSMAPSSAKAFTSQLFLELGNTMTVSDAAQSAANSLWWPWDEAKNFSLLGNGNTLVASPTVNNKTTTESNFASKQEFNAAMETFEYEKYELHGDGFRYYKTIDGTLTNDFYDVFDNGNRITKSKNTISQNDIAEIKQKNFVRTTETPDQNIAIDRSIGELYNSEEYTVYVKMDDKLIPIKIIYADYATEDGIAYKDVKCINLLDNSLVDYVSICSEK